MLASRWNTIQKRLQASDNEKKKIEALLIYKRCHAFFSQEKDKSGESKEKDKSSDLPDTNKSAKDNYELRCSLKELKAFFDESMELKVWEASSLRLRGTFFAILLVPAMLLLARSVLQDASLLTPRVCGLILAGVTGGLLSSIVRPSKVPAPLPSEFILLRPIIAGLAGLVFWLLLASEVVRIPSVKIAYLFAISVGFADDFLTKVLVNSSRGLAEVTRKTLGHETSTK
jgi:hypothetical protein